MTKIKVCHVVCGLISGGVESMILNYCSRLDSNKYEFHILHQHEAVEKNVTEFSNINCKIHRIPSKIKHPIKNYLSTYDYLKNNKIDVVHCHMTLMNFIPLIAAKKLGIKVRICHSHSSDVRKKNVFVKFIESILKRLCVNNASVLVACGEDAGKYLYGKKKFMIINNALDLDKYSFNIDIRNTIREKYNIKENEFLVGHIGRFVDAKNHKFIVEIIKKIVSNTSNIKFMLIGDGELKKEIETLVIDNNLQEKVIFTGVVSNAHEYYSAFDMFILPSLWEGLPVVSVEAQASGLPCLFSTNIDYRCIVDSTKSFMISLEIDEWVSKIIEFSLMNFSRKIEKVKFQKENFDIEQQANILENIYLNN